MSMKSAHNKRLFDLIAEYGMEGVVKELHQIAINEKDDEAATILGDAVEQFADLEDEEDEDEDEDVDDEDDDETTEDEE